MVGAGEGAPATRFPLPPRGPEVAGGCAWVCPWRSQHWAPRAPLHLYVTTPAEQEPLRGWVAQLQPAGGFKLQRSRAIKPTLVCLGGGAWGAALAGQAPWAPMRLETGGTWARSASFKRRHLDAARCSETGGGILASSPSHKAASRWSNCLPNASTRAFTARPKAPDAKCPLPPGARSPWTGFGPSRWWKPSLSMREA